MPNITYYRLDHERLGLPLSTIWMPLAAVGGPAGARELGFTRLGGSQRLLEVPESSTLAADMHTEREIGFVVADDETHFGGVEPPRVLEASFPDEHPAAWLATAHSRGQLLVLSSEGDFSRYRTIQEAMGACWGLRVPLVVRAYPEGVGTSPPG